MHRCFQHSTNIVLFIRRRQRDILADHPSPKPNPITSISPMMWFLYAQTTANWIQADLYMCAQLFLEAATRFGAKEPLGFRIGLHRNKVETERSMKQNNEVWWAEGRLCSSDVSSKHSVWALLQAKSPKGRSVYGDTCKKEWDIYRVM